MTGVLDGRFLNDRNPQCAIWRLRSRGYLGAALSDWQLKLTHLVRVRYPLMDVRAPLCIYLCCSDSFTCIWDVV